ncbi:MAG: DUF4238 domain-containing protein [Candidatus ainarchaeum sp.]|nr:DUF4238 domain-containing protein [Acholeplasmataceae bacterium]MDD3085139.1 DUF4238 domain-containing protein [Candidatus ainarchaeum sp.]
MPEKKKQHYVPKMLLKNFANENSDIIIYKRAENKILYDKPYSQQCQKDYFYGNDKIIEDTLGKFENIVDGIFKKILPITAEHELNKLDIDDFVYLRAFVVSQYLRTHGMMERTLTMSEDSRSQAKKIIAQFHRFYDHDETDEEALERLMPKKNKKDVAKNNVIIAFKCYSSYSDLALLIIDNKTDLNFITSDDPVIEKNYYYPRRGFGLELSGILYFLPISFKKAILLIDFNEYFKSFTQYISITDELDILKLNTWQFSKSNLLYSYDKNSLNITIKRCLDYINSQYIYAQKYIENEISKENVFLSYDAINMRVQEKLKNIEDFNKAIYDYVDEDNIPSFLCINDKIRSVGKKLYWGIPLRNSK